MIPFKAAYDVFIQIYELLPEPFKAFIITAWLLALGITTVTLNWRNN